MSFPTSYADVATFRFQRVLSAPPAPPALFDMIADLFDPSVPGQINAVVVSGPCVHPFRWLHPNRASRPRVAVCPAACCRYFQCLRAIGSVSVLPGVTAAACEARDRA